MAHMTLTQLPTLHRYRNFEFLEYLDAPRCVIEKASSAGLYEGQTDEGEASLTYAELDKYLLLGEGKPEVIEKIEKFHARGMHKTTISVVFKNKIN